MKRRVLLTALGYPAFFMGCFLVSLYLTFPMNLLRGRILEEMTRALNAQKNPGQYGKPGKVTAENVDLYRFTGVEFTNLVVTPVTTNPDPAIPYELDKVRVRLQLLPLIKKNFEFAFDVRAYDGHAEGTVVLAQGLQQLKALTASADGIAWGKIGVVREKLKVPAEGTVGGNVDMTFGKDAKEHAGTIKMKGEALAIGPGELAVPGFGSLTLPHIDLGKLDGDIKVAEGKTSGPPMSLNGKDIQGQLEMPLALRNQIDNSTINNGVMTFKLADEFLKANPKFQPVFDFTPQLKQAKDEEGVYHFRLKGTLGNPSPKPDKGAKITAAKG
ncbi:MAG: type II secretion system protein GspN [Myxococcota bacterium]